MVFLLRVLLRQQVIDHANWVRRDVAVRPSPLHDGVHTLTRAAGGFGLFEPGRAQYVLAVGGRDRVERLPTDLRERISLKRANPLRDVLLVLPSGFEFFVNLAGGFLEGERGGGDAGGILLTVASVNRVFACVELAAYGERLLTRARNRDFGIDAEARVVCP